MTDGGFYVDGYWLPDEGPVERLIDYCCPAAVEAYPAPCPDHGQDRADVATVPGGIVAPGGWCAPADHLNLDGTALPGPLCHYSIAEDGTVHMHHTPTIHRPRSWPGRLITDLRDGLRAGLRLLSEVAGFYDRAAGEWARRIVYDVHRPTYLPGSTSLASRVVCCHCSRGRDAVMWPCDPVLKVTP